MLRVLAGHDGAHPRGSPGWMAAMSATRRIPAGIGRRQQRLSLERRSPERTIQFVDVAVEPITLGEPNVDCPLKTPIAPG
jgi:hypothetical protein